MLRGDNGRRRPGFDRADLTRDLGDGPALPCRIPDRTPRIAVIGAGPAGLMAAETAARAGAAVTVFDHMPSPARKLLIAGRGGLNLTHAEPLEAFLTRYGAARDWLEPAIRHFPPAALIAWARGWGRRPSSAPPAGSSRGR